MAKAATFHCKQFSVRQDRCGQKIGTDSLLLGSWLPLEPGTSHLLDVGTGCGILALMLAQRAHTARVSAIEIDPIAAEQAAENVRNTVFHERIEVHHLPLQRFESPHLFDHVVSNPPYFEQAVKAKNASRTLARHTDSLPFEELVHHAKRLLLPTGKLSVILPLLAAEKFFFIARQQGFFLHHRCEIYSKAATKKPIRIVLQMGLHYRATAQHRLVIYEPDGGYSDQYQNLAKPFLTIF